MSRRVLALSFATLVGLHAAGAPADEAPASQPAVPDAPKGSWATVSPGEGFKIAKTELGEMNISLYALFRYINQLPADQTFTDHLGREHVVDTRNDFQFQRCMIFFYGWMYLPKFTYNATLWTVNATNSVAVIGSLGYRFSDAFNVFGGWNGLPGTASLLGSHPYWLAHDRVMVDEYFRPFFTSGIWVTGEPLWGFDYIVMFGNNLSQLNISAVELTRDVAVSGAVWWMPTTGEFGPRNGFGDFEDHQDLALRFGVNGTHSTEDRFAETSSNYPDNTSIRISDSLNLFEMGALADGVTMQKATYNLLTADAGLKYRGFYLQAEYYSRWLSGFVADGPLPVSSLYDWGFYVQAAYMVVPRYFELYANTSQIWGDFDRHPWEVLGGANYFFAGDRNLRLNAQLIWAHDSPVSSSFGFYVGGQDGPIVSFAASVFI